MGLSALELQEWVVGGGVVGTSERAGRGNAAAHVIRLSVEENRILSWRPKRNLSISV